MDTHIGRKIVRYCCFLLYCYFAKHLPMSTYPSGRMSRRLRYVLCKRMFRTCGKDVNVEHGADFMSGATIDIGDHSGIGVNAWIRADLVIGNNVMMGPQVIIYGRDHSVERMDVPMMYQGMEPFKKVIIEDNVWIGARAIILKGLRVGAGSIVGAGAVVTRDVPPSSIVAGNPARVIKWRHV